MRSPRLRVTHAFAVGAAALLSLLAISAARGEAPEDNHPTAWDCTVQTLLAEQQCFFGGEAQAARDAQAQGRDNTKVAAAWAAAGCQKAARLSGEGKPDAALYAGCLQEFQTAALDACALDGKLPLLDAKGRFPAEANGCYVALDKVLRHTRLLATLSAPCCRCLEKTCGALASCDEELLAREPGAQVTQCLSRGVCQGACEALVPKAAADDDDELPAAPPPAKRRQTTNWY